MTFIPFKTPHLLAYLLFALSFQGFGQIPPGYYDDADGLYADQLRQVLHQIIDGHTILESSELWYYFESTDIKPDGTVWDMYSDVPDGNPAYVFNFIVDQCGNYGQEGDCFNREHSFPQSWYGSAPPMSTDLFHVYPTDGFVNGIRGNSSFGQVGSANYITTNGSKRGVCNWPGCTGVVFEPIDEYKGDFARSFFYMLTRYYPQVSSWETDMVMGDNFAEWAIDMLLQWANVDPVSQKEINRNNVIFDIQGNRNPYIDRPEFASYVWDESVGEKEASSISSLNIWYANEVIWWETTTDHVRSIQIFDMMGRLVDTKDNPGTQFHLNDLSSGVYIARAQHKSEITVLRFVK